MMKALDVARYFLFLAKNEGAGDTISNLKMQKLLYYAQGYYLMLFNEPLFEEEIQAWRHGPVVKQVYDAFKKYSDNAISFDELKSFNATVYNATDTDVLPYIYRKYGKLGAWELRDKTHDEAPWKEHYSDYNTNIIPKESIRIFFEQEFQKELDNL